MNLIIDRFEGQYAVCEREGLDMVHIKVDLLPPGAKEGDILILEGGTITIDRKQTVNRKAEIQKLMDDLWE